MLDTDEHIPEKGEYPDGCEWKTMLGGGSWYYLYSKNTESKIYGAVRPENLGLAVQRTTGA